MKRLAIVAAAALVIAAAGCSCWQGMCSSCGGRPASQPTGVVTTPIE